MSKPLTTEERKTLETNGEGRTHRQYLAAKSALARLDYLERKVQAADRLANEVRFDHGLRAGLAVDAYDEVQP